MEYRRRPSLVGPLILITIGVLFLLANLGMLPLTFWEIAARFWPLILILIGLEIIIGRRSMIGALVVVVLWLALVGGVVYLSFAGGGILPTRAAATEQLAQPLGDIQSASVDMDIGTARTTVTALPPGSTDLMTGTFIHAEGTQITKTYNVSGNEGQLTLKEEGVNPLFFGGSIDRWDVALSPQIPLALRVSGGVGHGSFDLTALKATSLSIDAGVGNIDVTAPNTGNTTVQINGGVGSVAITIPEGVAASIRVNGGLGGIRVNEARFPKFGDVYQSTDYATAANKIDIQVEGGVGSISIN
jgi:LiaI-LiaF-like transmembrane region/Cell wall-active antibiotics response LiaF, C-terminal